MRTILFIALLMLPAGYASAVFYNNTETIEIGDGELPEPSPDSTTDSGTVNPGSSGGSSTGSSGAGSASGGSAGGGGGGSVGGSANENGTEGGANFDENGSAVIEALIAGGALSGVASGASGGADSGAGVSASGLRIRVVGSRVREALSGNLDLIEFLTYWRKGKGKAADAELGLIAASTALRDSNMQEVLFTASSFEIVYRSRGYLLGVLPWSFPVRLTIVPDAPVIEERVRVKLPWYRFFVRKFFTVGGLQRDIDELLASTKAGNIDGDLDSTVLLFEATADFLRKKVGTVADSVLLGTLPQ